jgi:hypothetical protein
MPCLPKYMKLLSVHCTQTYACLSCLHVCTCSTRPTNTLGCVHLRLDKASSSSPKQRPHSFPEFIFVCMCTKYACKNKQCAIGRQTFTNVHMCTCVLTHDDVKCIEISVNHHNCNRNEMLVLRHVVDCGMPWRGHGRSVWMPSWCL